MKNNVFALFFMLPFLCLLNFTRATGDQSKDKKKLQVSQCFDLFGLSLGLFCIRGIRQIDDQNRKTLAIALYKGVRELGNNAINTEIYSAATETTTSFEGSEEGTVGKKDFSINMLSSAC